MYRGGFCNCALYPFYQFDLYILELWHGLANGGADIRWVINGILLFF